jgi:hypothetical protein
MFSDVMYIDLLLVAEYKKYLSQPELLREMIMANPEIKIPKRIHFSDKFSYVRSYFFRKTPVFWSYFLPEK